MILTDLLFSKPDMSWQTAHHCGIEKIICRLPESDDFDLTDYNHWSDLYKKYTDYGFTPVGIEPIPNRLHDHIKTGDGKRDESIEKFIKMLEIMGRLDIRLVCFNFMAHVGWTRTRSDIKERGSYLTGFDINDFKSTGAKITEEELWGNYHYFMKAVLPYAEKYGVKLALHPDDPPVKRLGEVSRIMITPENIEKAVKSYNSNCLGITFCQATFSLMDKDIINTFNRFKEKVFFVHFRNVTGNKFSFRETFHDSGNIDTAKIIDLYRKNLAGIPVRVDHVPTLEGESPETEGYGALGRLFANGYLKGLLGGQET